MSTHDYLDEQMRAFDVLTTTHGLDAALRIAEINDTLVPTCASSATTAMSC